jgi:hypothetical protein
MNRKAPWLVLAALAIACGGGAEGDASADSAAAVEGDAATAASAPAATPAAAPLSTPVIDTAAAAGERPLLREVYGWQGGGRDPFRSMVTTASTGPELPDLTLVAIIYDRGNPSNSLAMFRETGSNRRFSVGPGQSIGRLTVAAVRPNSATLRLNDFGTVREQTYSLRQTEDEAP